MTDQDRREEVAEGELLNDLLDAAETPATQPATAVTETTATVAPAEEVEASPVNAATEEPETTDGDALVQTSDAVSEETAGASFTPVDESESGRPRRLKDLEVGMELQGRVTSIALYGIFVDLGVGRDGLVHISEMSDTRIESPSDLVQINDTVTVRIKSIDLDARRISLTMRSRGGEGRSRSRPKRAEVDRDVLASLKPGDTVEGSITGMAPFGAFADIGVGKDGLIHISELSETRVEKPEDAVQVGERYTFKVLEVDPDGTRISLSLRRAQRSQKMQQLEPGQILEGTVSGLAPFGAFVDIGVGRDGLVHISALSDRRVEKVEDVVKEGDHVKVRVLEVDPQSKRISLTMRLEDPEPVEAEPQSTVIPRTGPAAAPRFAAVSAAREEGRREDRRKSGGGKGNRPAPNQAQSSETYTTDSEPEEEFEGNATLEDLLSKYGGNSNSRRDRDFRRREGDEEEDDSRFARRQRDAIRRTLQQVARDE